MGFLVWLLVFLAMTGYSSATYCLCKDGVSEQVLQKALDYACGAGADCSAILQNGACFQPNTVKSHCDYAVNSYFQRKGQITGSCDFAGAATTSANSPSSVATGCSYPSSPSTTGTTTTTPTTTTPTTTTPTGGTTGTSTGTTTGTTTPSSVFPGTTGTGLGPTGSGFNDQGTATALPFSRTNLFFSFAVTAWFSEVLFLWG